MFDEKRNIIVNNIKELLQYANDGEHVLLDYDTKVLDIVLFDYNVKDNCKSFNENFNHEELKKIDFSNVCFNNYLVSENDFKDLYGVKVNPNKLKFLEDGCLENVELLDEISWPMYKKRIVNPDNIKNQIIINIESQTVGFCRYTPEVRFNNVRFKMDFNTKITEIYNCDFRGSSGLIIDNHNFIGCMGFGSKVYKIGNSYLDGVTFDLNINKFNRFKFWDNKSNGICGKIKINPQNIYGKNLKNNSFNGVKFTGKFDGVNISGCDFTGSSNAVIDLRTCELTYNDTILKDAKVIGLEETDSMLDENGVLRNINNPVYSCDVNSVLDSALSNKEQIKIEEKKLEIIEKHNLEERKKKIYELKGKILEINEIYNNLKNKEFECDFLYHSIIVDEDLFLIKKDNHYEINCDVFPKNVFIFLNLSKIDFKNAKVSGYDFSGTGARINPQYVYNKNISDCVLDDTNIKFYDSLEGVIDNNTNYDKCMELSRKTKYNQ